jgi:hypothetical protein
MTQRLARCLLVCPLSGQEDRLGWIESVASGVLASTNWNEGNLLSINQGMLKFVFTHLVYYNPCIAPFGCEQTSLKEWCGRPAPVYSFHRVYAIEGIFSDATPKQPYGQ